MSEDNMLHTISEILEEAYPTTKDKRDNQYIEIKKNNFIIIKNGTVFIFFLSILIILFFLLIKEENLKKQAKEDTICVGQVTAKHLEIIDRRILDLRKNGISPQKAYAKWRKKYGYFRKKEMPCNIYEKIIQE
jgi:uncharacterized membrane protein YukC